MEIPGFKENIPDQRFFKHLGHNPRSGDLHYQCPGCRIVLLIKPMGVLDEVGMSCRHVRRPDRMSRELTGPLKAMYH